MSKFDIIFPLVICIYLLGTVVSWGHYTSRPDVVEKNYEANAPVVAVFWPFYMSDQIWKYMREQPQ